jgi:DNA-3-methyladenine glycosylase
MKIDSAFFLGSNVTLIAKQLLGKKLITNFNNQLTSGIIVETEAYAGITDKASHAYGAKRTNRTEIMYNSGGTIYVYLCYGIHHLFNIVTNKKDIPDAVLLRAIEPIDGIDIMLARRNKKKQDYTLTSGPGTLSEALGIKTNYSGQSIQNSDIWIEDIGLKIPENEIICSPRVGVAYAQEDALLPYRFRIKNNKYTSNAK